MLDAFHLELGEVSRDGQVSVDLTACTGLCDQGPAMLVNGRPIARLTPARIGALCALIRGGSPVDQWPDNLFTIDTHIERRDRLLDTVIEPGAALDAAIARGAAGVIAELRTSELRGRGGAGFSAGQKWSACAAAPGPERYIVCNADEGEPGTFKDRVLLTTHLEQLLEGMTIAPSRSARSAASSTCGASTRSCSRASRQALSRGGPRGCSAQNIRGVRGFDFDIELHTAPAPTCAARSRR
jgi:[NiFe] hydrogenase diaphorase moiety large subunit